MSSTDAIRRVSYSELSTLDCWKKHDFMYVRGLKPRDTPRPLTTGRAWDDALNTLYAPEHSSKPAWERRNLAHHAIDESSRESTLALPVGADDAEREIEEQRQLLHKMLDHYCLHWGEQDERINWVARQLEFEVAMRAPSGNKSSRYRLRGYIDGIAEIDGKYFIWEDKSAKALDANLRRGVRQSRQLLYYAWAVQTERPDIPISGVIWNGAAKVVPVDPPFLKSGKDLHKMIRSDGGLQYLTTPQQYLNALTTLGLDVERPDELPEEHQRALSRLWQMQRDPEANPFFWRHEVLLPPSRIDAMGAELHATSLVIDKLPPQPMPNQMKCNMCSFSTVCIDEDPDTMRMLYSTPEERAASRALAEAQQAAEDAADRDVAF